MLKICHLALFRLYFLLTQTVQRETAARNTRAKLLAALPPHEEDKGRGFLTLRDVLKRDFSPAILQRMYSAMARGEALLRERVAHQQVLAMVRQCDMISLSLLRILLRLDSDCFAFFNAHSCQFAFLFLFLSLIHIQIRWESQPTIDAALLESGGPIEPIVHSFPAQIIHTISSYEM